MSRDLSEASEERRWAPQPNLSDPNECYEVMTPETSSEELSPDPDCKEGKCFSERRPKGNLKVKGKGGYGAKGGQQAPNPKSSKGKGEDPQGIQKDLARIEEKVDALLQKMDQFTKEARTPPPAAEEEKEKTPKPQQPQPPQPPRPPPAPPLPVWKVPQQQQQGGKGQRRSKAGTQAVTKAAPAKVGGGASGGAVGKSA